MQRTQLQNSTDDHWEQLAAFVEGFLAEWEANGFGPMLSDHLPKDPGPLQRMVLVELIKVDLEYRHHSDGPILRLEDYLAENPLLAEPDGIPAELIYEEYHIRRAVGESVDVDDCLNRFPDRADAIAQVFQLESTSAMSADGASLSETFQPGERVGDFYLMSRLGAGAFGSVFLARQESMQRLVALKISGDRGTEGQTLAQLDHPHIVRVHDQTRLPEQNLRLLYMQFAPGGTLLSVVRASQTATRRTGQIVADVIAKAVDQTGILSSQSVTLKAGLAEKSWAEVVCQLGTELAEALSYAHGRGILHRDIKPANVLLEANGSAKLADFNISFSSAAEGSTPAAYFGGSLAYMSPEQLEAFDPLRPVQPQDLDERADIFSLGVLLWELFFGKRPFPDDSVTGNREAQLAGMIELRQRGVVPPADTLVTAVEQRLLSILRRCLAPDPDDRYQNAHDLARDLRLSLQPRVAGLLHRSLSGWRRRAAAWPGTSFLFAAVAPHVPAAVFNFVYNDTAIIEQLSDQAKAAFQRIVVIINVVAFSIGIGCCLWYILPVRQALCPQDSDAQPSYAAARQRSLRLSRFVTALGITEWLIAGMAYPIALNSITDGLEAKWQAHLFTSLLVCGLVAAAYPFFLTATLAIRSYLPALMHQESLSRDDLADLRRLSDRSVWSLYLAGGVPAAGIMILLTTQEAGDPRSAFALKVLSLLGAVGFAVTLNLAKSLQSDIEALLESARHLTEAEET